MDQSQTYSIETGPFPLSMKDHNEITRMLRARAMIDAGEKFVTDWRIPKHSGLRNVSLCQKPAAACLNDERDQTFILPG